jgi:phosphoribosylformylglycinamidine (FGAM) synthase-like enzyme
MAQLSAAIDGIAEACMALGTPITGGNVSLYNETRGEGIYPTPVVGVVGILDDVTKAVRNGFPRKGEIVMQIGAGLHANIAPIALKELGSSEFAGSIVGELWGEPPYLDLEGEGQLQKCLARLAQIGLISSATDISEGGIAVALAEASMSNGIGVDVELIPVADAPGVAAVFGESASQVIVTFPASVRSQVEETVFGFSELSVAVIGSTVRDKFRIRLHPGIASDVGGTIIDLNTSGLKASWSGALESLLAEEVMA